VALALVACSDLSLVTFDRIRRGGKQTVKVVHVHQHVAVENGGQAVVAGTMKGRGRHSGGDLLTNTRARAGVAMSLRNFAAVRARRGRGIAHERRPGEWS
jgi:hypothetical protein